MNKRQEPTQPPCYCGNGRPYMACCQPFHQGHTAPNAEALMRSRYSAYVLNLEDYLLQTWHANTRPTTPDLALDVQIQWLGLEIKRTETKAVDHAIVEFVARYKLNGKAHKLHEVSQFVKLDGRWFYVDGTFPDKT